MSWSTAELCTDADLTAVESRMPSLAQAIKRPGSLETPYSGKRALAKTDIGLRLVRMSVVLDDLTDTQVSALNRAAVYRELSLIYMDLADRNDTVSQQKSAHYGKLYEDSWTDIVLALGIPASQTGIGFIPAYRA